MLYCGDTELYIFLNSLFGTVSNHVLNDILSLLLVRVAVATGLKGQLRLLSTSLMLLLSPQFPTCAVYIVLIDVLVCISSGFILR